MKSHEQTLEELRNPTRTELNEYEKHMAVPHICRLGCTVLPADHWLIPWRDHEFNNNGATTGCCQICGGGIMEHPRE